MTVVLDYRVDATVVETLETNVPVLTATAKQVRHTLYNRENLQLNGATTPPVTKVAIFSKAMSGGAATIDLAALTGTNGAAVDGTGLKVQLFKIKAPAANSAAVTIAVGASNGYDLSGSAFSLTLAPGQEMTLFGNDATPDIGSSDKELDMSGSGTDALECVCVMG